MASNIERIEKYFNGQLKVEERIRFETELENNPELKKTFYKYKIVDKAIENQISIDLKGKLITWENESALIRQSKIKRYKLLFAIASLLLLLIVFLLVNHFSNNDLKEFASQNYVEIEKGALRGEELNAYLIESKAARSAQDMEALERYVMNNSADYKSKIYLAQELVKQKKYSESLKYLKEVIDDNSIRYREKAEWNYVIISLLNDNFQEGEIYFNRMLDSVSHSYHQRALSLKQLMEKQ